MSTGYGQFRTRQPRKHVLAHRYSWDLANGPIPDGMQVCHQCDNPSCVNPAHLFLGSNQDNVTDMVAKDRVQRGMRHHKAKLTDDQVEQIRVRLVRGERQRLIAADYGVTQSCVSMIGTGESRKPRY